MGFTFAKQRRALALVAFIAISFAQAAFFAHLLFDAHDVNDTCEVCIVSERLADAIGNPDILIAVTNQPLERLNNYPSSLLSNEARTVRARSPPRSNPI